MWKRVLSLAAVVAAVGACSKPPPPPKPRVPPEDIWASMRELEKQRKEVDRALSEWNAELLATSAMRVASEIQSFPDKYEGISPEFLKFADGVRERAAAAAGAVKNDDFAGARASWGEALKACQKCHQAWSGPKTGYELPPETPRPPPPPKIEEPPPAPESQPVDTKKKPKKKPKK